MWTLVAFFLPIVGLLLYLCFAREEEEEEEKRICPQCGLGVPSRHNFCPSCGKQLVVAQDLRYKTCMFCGRKIAEDAKFCDTCGKAQE
jgi:RNA polymerase subunit RPABC4/transcription elongation factor Spt4